VLQEKSWIGKKPNTRAALTDKGRVAFLNWASTILSALPSQLNPELFIDKAESQEPALPAQAPKLPAESGSAKVLWFLPTYHRWDISVPPIDGINQQCC